MLGQPYSGKLEKMVGKISLSNLYNLLYEGYSVIVDDTNFKKEKIDLIVDTCKRVERHKEVTIKVTVKKLTIHPVKAIYRDIKRSIFTNRKMVGVRTILHFNRSYQKCNFKYHNEYIDNFGVCTSCKSKMKK